MTNRSPPITKADNLRTHRRRKREGTMVVPPTEVRPLMRDKLIDCGHLSEWDEDDVKKVAEALDAFLREVSGDEPK